MRALAIAIAVVTAALLGLTFAFGPTSPPVEEVGPAQFAVRGRWPGEGLPRLTFRADVARSPIDGEAFVRAVTAATRAWNATGVVDLKPAADGSAADVTLSWQRGHHGACLPFGPEADVAHSGPVRQGTFIHFDLGRDWSEQGEEGRISVFHTALHELGHVIGLGHSEAATAVMGTSPERPAALAWHDLAGLHSLYGGGTDGAGDVRITSPGRDRVTFLRRTAPWESTDFGVFDCDGDGRDEVLVWRTDDDGHGALSVYHYSAALQLEASYGPFYGALAVGGTVGFATAPDGTRLLVCEFDNGRRLCRQFDAHGNPGRYYPAEMLTEEATHDTGGDLDGDGVDETLTR